MRLRLRGLLTGDVPRSCPVPLPALLGWEIRPVGELERSTMKLLSCSRRGTAPFVGLMLGVGVMGTSAPVSAGLDTFEVKMNAWEAAAGDRFGASVALCGNTAVIGANSFDPAAEVFMSGSA